MRLWKVVGDAAFVLLVAALAVGPVARLMRSARSLLRWRRQLGIWFAMTATPHAALILNGWARWSLRRVLGYEVIPQLGCAFDGTSAHRDHRLRWRICDHHSRWSSDAPSRPAH